MWILTTRSPPHLPYGANSWKTFVLRVILNNTIFWVILSIQHSVLSTPYSVLSTQQGTIKVETGTGPPGGHPN